MKVLINNGKSNEDIARTNFASEQHRKARKTQKSKINGLVYAAEDKIYLYRRNKKDILVTERNSMIYTLCSHNGELYDAGLDEKVFKTLTNEEIASRDNSIYALCSHNGELYDAGDYKKVFKTLTNEEIASREYAIWTLCSHNGELYDAGDYKKVFKTLTNEEIASRDNLISTLCSHNGELYDAGADKKIFKPITKEIISLDKSINALCSIDPNLVDKILEMKRK